MTAPGFYSLRFFLAGRGHDATEFQDAQAALGLSYSGHAADWLFIGLFITATVFWFWRTKTRVTLRLVGRLTAGVLVALLAVVLLQSINNAVFDPLFETGPRSTRH
jgi:di/tricarboxylate transporter